MLSRFSSLIYFKMTGTRFEPATVGRSFEKVIRVTLYRLSHWLKLSQHYFFKVDELQVTEKIYNKKRDSHNVRRSGGWDEIKWMLKMKLWIDGR
ncbi:uncharacterized protein LOC107265258 isoform X2 [Cephus cinctus]|uniref:Uncharacterized protein LOC107265258 isoform X2 n=1 Tax=Cephus cinctus TaxID=211228 RepID=A0AAJ7RC01_CEPCN|nr:uncharacterized protein LOC107265258 isoform X2 [Cephus cinctus]